MTRAGRLSLCENITISNMSWSLRWTMKWTLRWSLISVLVLVPSGHYVSARGVPLYHGALRRTNRGGNNGDEVAHHGRHGTRARPHVTAQRNSGRELWLTDFTQEFLDEMQGDGAGRAGSRHGLTETCPPPFLQAPRDACRMATCTSDTECLISGQRCCNNGCIFTCMDSMPPPPLIDWRREPPRKEKGIAWLLPKGNNTDNIQAEQCSTSQLADDEDALLCAHGYMCHIEFLGDTARGIPNRGRCVPDVNTAHGLPKARFHIITEDGDNTDRCHIPNRGFYPNGARFRYENHMCMCREGSVECHVKRTRG